MHARMRKNGEINYKETPKNCKAEESHVDIKNIWDHLLYFIIYSLLSISEVPTNYVVSYLMIYFDRTFI